MIRAAGPDKHASRIVLLAMRFRLANPADLETCRSLIHPGLRMRTAVHDALADLWRDLIASDVACLCVIEDATLPYPRRIEVFAGGGDVGQQ